MQKQGNSVQQKGSVRLVTELRCLREGQDRHGRKKCLKDRGERIVFMW